MIMLVVAALMLRVKSIADQPPTPAISVFFLWCSAAGGLLAQWPKTHREREKTKRRKVEVGSSPLHRACREGTLQDVLDLLGRCEVVQVNATEGRSTPLHAAVDGKQCKAIRVLVDAGGDIHARTFPRATSRSIWPAKSAVPKSWRP